MILFWGVLFSFFCHAQPTLGQIFGTTQNPSAWAPAPVSQVRFGATCTPAVPLTLGQNASFHGRWVAYSRPTQVQLFSPQIETVGVFDVATGQDYFPALPGLGSGSVDFFPKIVDDTLFFVRFGGGTASLIALNVNQPNQFQIVEAGRLSPFFGFPGILSARGGNEVTHLTPNDFAISWVSRTFQPGTGPAVNFCNVADCLQSNFSSLLLPGSMGSAQNANIVDVDVSYDYGISGVRPGFVYSMYQNGQTSIVADNWGSESTVAGPVASPSGFANIAYSGLFLIYTRLLNPTQSKVVMTMPTLSNIPLFESTPPMGASDSLPGLSMVPLASGFLMVWSRTGNPGSRVMATYVDPSPQRRAAIPVEIPLSPILISGGFDDCSSPAVFGQDVVFHCKSERYPNIPVIVKSSCAP